MKVLVVDIGGTTVKLLATGMDPDAPIRIPSGPAMTASQLVEDVVRATAHLEYEAVSIGYPGAIVRGAIALEPHNLAPGWVGFDFAGAFGRPVKLLNDAAMQALGAYEGGRMLFLGLGTGLGSALVIDGVVAPMELAHLPYKKGRTFEDYVGIRGLDRLGKRRWREAVADVVARLKAALVADYVVLGGGNVNNLKALPEACRRGDNADAFLGGFRLWEPRATFARDAGPDAPPARPPQSATSARSSRPSQDGRPSRAAKSRKSAGPARRG